MLKKKFMTRPKIPPPPPPPSYRSQMVGPLRDCLFKATLSGPNNQIVLTEFPCYIAKCRQIYYFIIKFRYNARSDWLKERALSEYRTWSVEADQFLFLLRHFDEFDPKINILFGSDKRKEKRAICLQ